MTELYSTSGVCNFVVDDTVSYPIAPTDIASGPLTMVFGAAEREIAARWIIDFCRERGSWASFTHSEIELFMHRKGATVYRFEMRSMLGTEEVPLCEDRKYRVTHQFIVRCFRAHPSTTHHEKSVRILRAEPYRHIQ